MSHHLAKLKSIFKANVAKITIRLEQLSLYWKCLTRFPYSSNQGMSPPKPTLHLGEAPFTLNSTKSRVFSNQSKSFPDVPNMQRSLYSDGESGSPFSLLISKSCWIFHFYTTINTIPQIKHVLYLLSYNWSRILKSPSTLLQVHHHVQELFYSAGNLQPVTTLLH